MITQQEETQILSALNYGFRHITHDVISERYEHIETYKMQLPTISVTVQCRYSIYTKQNPTWTLSATMTPRRIKIAVKSPAENALPARAFALIKKLLKQK